MIAAIAFAAFAVFAPATATVEASAAKPYISGFCVPFALGGGEPDRLRRLFSFWNAKAEPDSAADAYRPNDADVSGQMATFPDASAPHAFLDRRRGTCSLVFDGPGLPPLASDDFRNTALPIGGYSGTEVEHWRRVSTKRVGPPGPIRYFIPSSDVVGEGVCATAFEDLRLRNNSSVVLVRVSLCRLGPDDALD